MISEIFSLIKKEKNLIFLGFLISVVFFFLRLTNLTLLPVFADEAIYLRWAQVMRAEPTLRFLPLFDGKQPLYMWLVMVTLQFFKDPLFLGRLLSIFAGFASLLGLITLSLLLFKKSKAKIALLAAFFYAITPYFLFFDRMALVDSLLTALGIWVLILSLLLARFLRLDLGLITGLVLGAALITKSPALFFALLLPLALIPTPWFKLKDKKIASQLIKFGLLLAVVYFFGAAIYNLLRLGPNFNMIASRNQDYVFPLSWLLSHPFDPLKPHLNDLLRWYPNLFTWPLFLLSFLGSFWGLKQKETCRPTLWLLAVCLLPLFAQSVFAKVFTPRYLLFASWPCLILAAQGLSFLPVKKKPTLVLLLLLLTVLPLNYDFQLLTDPQKAPLPRRMRSGYLEEWTAGYGLKEMAAFLAAQAQKGPVLVGTEGTFGTLPDGLQLYLEGVPQIRIIGFTWPTADLNQALINSLVDNQVFFIAHQSRLQISPQAYGLNLIQEHPKAADPEGKQDQLLLFEVDKDFWQEK